MQTETRSYNKTVATDTQHALEWLKTKYPRGADLTYVDYRDSLDEHPDVILDIVKEGCSGKIYDWFHESEWESVNDIIKEYEKTLDGVDELDSSVADAMQEWCYEHDTSDVLNDLLKNTRPQLFFLTTDVESLTDNRNVKELVRRFGSKDVAREAEIRQATNEQFYPEYVSFYFLADVDDVRDAIQAGKKYVQVRGAFYGNVDRSSGSNWLGERPIFNLLIPTDAFKENIHLDNEPGTGYGWQKIAGVSYSRQDASAIRATNKKEKGHIILFPAESEEAKRERRLQEHWDKTHTCTHGDMNYSRHAGEKKYTNNFPCGTTCSTCGTFWID